MEADTGDLICQAIRLLLDHRHRVGGVALVDAGSEGGTEAVLLEEYHDAVGVFAGPPCVAQRGRAFVTDALHLSEALRMLVEDLQGLLAELVNETLRHDLPDAGHEPRAEVGDDGFARCRPHHLIVLKLELPPVATVVDPVAVEAHVLPHRQTQSAAHGSHLFLTHLQTGDCVAALGVVKDDLCGGAFDYLPAVCSRAFFLLFLIKQVHKLLPIHPSGFCTIASFRLREAVDNSHRTWKTSMSRRERPC